MVCGHTYIFLNLTSFLSPQISSRLDHFNILYAATTTTTTIMNPNDFSSSSSSSPNSNNGVKYKGVRKRKWGKWVSEIRLPNSRERIWLGSYDTPEKAARAFDAALLCLRGRNAKFNFSDTPPPDSILGGRGRSLTPGEIQVAASRYANEHAQQAENTTTTTTTCPSSTSDGHGVVSTEAIDWSFLDVLDQEPARDQLHSGSDYNNMMICGMDNLHEDMQYMGMAVAPHHFHENEDIDQINDHEEENQNWNIEDGDYYSHHHQSFLWNF